MEKRVVALSHPSFGALYIVFDVMTGYIDMMCLDRRQETAEQESEE